jgi:hypothetical protein
VAADPPAHAFSRKHDSAVVLAPQHGQRRTVGGDQLRQRIRRLPAFEPVRIVECDDPADFAKKPREGLHPWASSPNSRRVGRRRPDNLNIRITYIFA